MRDMKCWFQTVDVAKIDRENIIDILKSNHFSKLSRMQQKNIQLKNMEFILGYEVQQS
jgi:hypothetical protein